MSLETYNIHNPFNNKLVGSVPIANEDTIDALFNDILNAEIKLSINEKKSILQKTANKLNQNKEKFANLISLESGLSLKDTIYEIGRVINCAKYSIKVCDYVNRDLTDNFLIDNENKPELSVIREPLDLALAITPFNHPMNQVAHKIFPALIAGTKVILKPSEKTPLSAIKLLEIMYDSGMPRNLIKIITTDNPSFLLNKLLSKGHFDMVTFTGGLEAGLKIKRALVENNHLLTKYVPELGGSSSLIVCDDADLDLAVKHILNGCFKNSGQRCTSIRRVIADKKIIKKFTNKLLKKVKEINYGDPFNKNTELGTVISEDSAKEIQKRIDNAISLGANLLYGNIRKGALLSPTLIDNMTLDMHILKEETFGPVCPILEAVDFEEALLMAKNTKYRLAGGIITNDISKAKKASDFLAVGQFSYNGPPSYRTEVAPFGGFGFSGNGEKEGILLAAEGFQRIRTFYNHN